MKSLGRSQHLIAGLPTKPNGATALEEQRGSYGVNWSVCPASPRSCVKPGRNGGHAAVRPAPASRSPAMPGPPIPLNPLQPEAICAINLPIVSPLGRHWGFERADSAVEAVARMAAKSTLRPAPGLRAEPNLRPAAVLLAANDNQLAPRSHDSLGPISRVVLTLVLLTLWIGVFFARLFSS